MLLFFTSKTETHDNLDFCKKKPDSRRPEQTTLMRFSPQRRGHSADYCLSIFSYTSKHINSYAAFTTTALYSAQIITDKNMSEELVPESEVS